MKTILISTRFKSNMLNLIHQLETGLQNPLPGSAAHSQMVAAESIRHQYYEIPDDPLIASVLILLYPKNKQWHLVLIQRVSRDKRDRHSGQISFPGGRAEASDPDLLFTAIREGQEEVGIDPKQINPIGKLTPLYIPVSNFLVHPFVSYTTSLPEFVPQLSEVASIIETPLDHLLDPTTIQKTEIKTPTGFKLKDVPHFNVEGHVVWGATAMILSEFLNVVESNIK